MASLVFLGATLMTISKSSQISSAKFGNVDASTPTAGTSGVLGTINAYNGFLWYNLDFSAVDWTSLPTNCSADGLSWHVHTLWSYGYSSPPDDQLVCSSSETAGHFDPWYACGPASSAAECESNGGCIPPSSVYMTSSFYDGNYTCTPDDYDVVSYACEVGDWSGKYGRIMLDGNMMANGTFGNFHEVNQNWLSPDNAALSNGGDGYSMTIHCGTGERVFCAPFLRENIANTPTFPLDGDQTIETNFNDAGDDFVNFTVKWNNRGIEFNVPDSAKAICDSWDVWYYTDWAWYGDGASARTNCDISNFNGVLDLTHSCIDDSGSPFCSNGTRCNGTTDTQTTYSCGAGSSDGDDQTTFWGCAVGDVSSRIGSISSSSNGQLIQDRMSPPLFALGNRAIVLKCSSNANMTGDVQNICALTEQTNGTIITLEPFGTPTPTDIANTLLYGMNILFICVVATLFN